MTLLWGPPTCNWGARCCLTSSMVQSGFSRRERLWPETAFTVTLVPSSSKGGALEMMPRASRIAQRASQSHPSICSGSETQTIRERANTIKWQPIGWCHQLNHPLLLPFPEVWPQQQVLKMCYLMLWLGPQSFSTAELFRTEGWLDPEWLTSHIKVILLIKGFLYLSWRFVCIRLIQVVSSITVIGWEIPTSKEGHYHPVVWYILSRYMWSLTGWCLLTHQSQCRNGQEGGLPWWGCSQGAVNSPDIMLLLNNFQDNNSIASDLAHNKCFNARVSWRAGLSHRHWWEEQSKLAELEVTRAPRATTNVFCSYL